MKKIRVLAVALASFAVIGFGSMAPSAQAACSVNVQAQVDAQNAAIAELQAMLVTATPRTAAVLNAQIAARQAAVAAMVASC